MKNKRIFIFLIVIAVIVSIFLLTSSTYLWYFNNNKVGTQTTQVSSSPAIMNIEISPMGDSSYMGQTGKDAQMDAPFRKHFNLTLECNDDEKTNVRIRINELAIKMWNYDPNQGSENIQELTEEEIKNDFTFRFFYSGYTYAPDQNGFLYYLEGGVTTYLVVEKNEIMDGMLTLIYLGEESYLKWQNEDYESYDEFAYCSPDYMGATFSFYFEFLLDEAVINISEQVNLEFVDSDFVPTIGDSISNTYEFIASKQIMSNVNKTLKVSIINVSRVRNEQVYNLTVEEIANNFTLRIKYNEKDYLPSKDELTYDYFYSEENQNVEWFTMQENQTYMLEINVIGQDETDYTNMLDDPLYVSTYFAYGEQEYAEDVFIYQIRVQMVNTPE